MLGLVLLGSAAEAAPIEVASAIQPLLDDTLIATMDPALERVMHAPPFDQVVMQPAALSPAPWEEGFALEVLGTSVVRTLSGRLRMYYTLRWGGLNAAGVPVSHVEAKPEMFLVGIAESDNGVEWTKPLLDRPFSSKLNGANVSRSNILGLAGTVGGSTYTVWVEPSAPASSRYRAVSSGKTSVGISYSADGITWRRHAGVEIPPIEGVGAGLDSQPIIFPDPGCGCHALYTRIDGSCKPAPGRPCPTDPHQRPFRMVRRVDVNSLDGNGTVGRQAVVIQSDAVDLAAHASALKFPDMGCTLLEPSVCLVPSAPRPDERLCAMLGVQTTARPRGSGSTVAGSWATSSFPCATFIGRAGTACHPPAPARAASPVSCHNIAAIWVAFFLRCLCFGCV